MWTLLSCTGLCLIPQAHSPLKPTLVFVSSRRQTRLTALDLIAFAAADERAEQFVHMPEDELQDVLANIRVSQNGDESV